MTYRNGERFTGLNFRIFFHGFQEYRESFSMNISASFIILNNEYLFTADGQGNGKYFRENFNGAETTNV